MYLTILINFRTFPKNNNKHSYLFKFVYDNVLAWISDLLSSSNVL